MDKNTEVDMRNTGMYLDAHLYYQEDFVQSILTLWI